MKINKNKKNKRDGLEVLLHPIECGYESQVWNDVLFIPRIGEGVSFRKRDSNNVTRTFKIKEITWTNNGQRCIIDCGW